MQKVKFLFHALLISLLVFSGCKDKNNDEVPEALTANDFPDKGDFHLVYGISREKGYSNIVTAELRENKIADHMIGELNRLFKLPHNVSITFRQAGDTMNAWYSSDTRTITFTTKMVDTIYTIFATRYEGDQLRTKAMNAVIFILFHEIGHALTDIYDLTVRGPEEDLVDYFSLFLLTTGDELAEDAAVDGASFFNVMARSEEDLTVRSLGLWDEHALSKKRYYNIITMVYGKNPEKYSYFITQRRFPIEKTPRFQHDYERVMESWYRDLRPYLIKQL